MFYVQVQGGLGNQLFQYAAALSLSYNRLIPFYLDINDGYSFVKRTFGLGAYGIEPNQELFPKELPPHSASRVDNASLSCIASFFCEQNDYQLDEAYFTVPDNSYISGYWQNELYFKKYADKIRNSLVLKKKISKRASFYYTEITNKNSPVSIHLRYGDYVDNSAAFEIHSHCPPEYYANAIAYIERQVPEAYFLIFSDDPLRAKTDLILKRNNYQFIEPGFIRPEEDLFLMSKCKHHIIANSTFSWWGAWLNICPEKIVLAPRKWLNKSVNNPVPREWITI